ncbi:MAG: hypothetical protein IKV47_08200 [Oscillospiraceae bacterium]|nr:hypothetical protein [Oscillospiraceae bacterium]
MTRQQYIAELHSLLGFMSNEDRQRTIDKYNRMFNKAADEQELITRLGTPTRVAIKLAGEYVPSTPEQRAEEDAERELYESKDKLFEGATPSPVEADIIAQVKAISGIINNEQEVSTEVEVEAEVEVETEPTPTHKVRRVKGGMLVFYTLLSIIIGLPIAVVLVLFGLAFSVPGVGAGYLVYLALPQLLAPLSLFSDMALAIGAALVVSAVALVLVWFGLWLAITLAKLWIGGAIFGLGRKLCIKEVDAA